MPMTRSPPPEEGVKKKKPPACDSCKARRVLCHPTTDGTACPRCIEKGTKCTTTPVARGRPPKRHLGLAQTPPSTSESEPQPSDSHSNTSSPIVFMPSQNSTRLLQLSPELVHHLFECFAYSPHCSHPLFRSNNLRNALSSVSWQIYLLPPQLRVLAHCVITLSASISIDHAILGPGPQPASFNDRSVFTRGADLRAYGIRRAPMYRALRAQTLQFACEAAILLEPSEDNAASCFFMQFLEYDNEARSRPWAVAYLSHVRAIAASWDDIDPESYRAALWNGFLMVEVLENIRSRQPVLVSHNDQLLITGFEPVSLENLFASLQSGKQAPKQQHPAFTATSPFVFHVTLLARQLYETITGDFARRHPLDETAVTQFLSALTLLHSIRCLVFDQGDPATAPVDPLFHGSPHTLTKQVNIHSCALTMVFSYTTLVLALHRELARRASLTPTTSTPIAMGQWAAQRIDLLRRQVCEMARFAVEEVARTLPGLPSLPLFTHIYHSALVATAQFCLEDVVPERVGVIEAIVDALKLVGYSWTLPPGLVERLEACVGTPRAEPPAFVEDSMLMDMFPSSLDSSWMEMFMMPLGGEGQVQHEPAIALDGTQTQ
ncbi:hypothetical protein FB451DRAFT_447261 [Mycena latifolia]|nr:hypothetical protein FB451DRAFT_447261 [Mycena latifolia]